jgi:hypothetical protein
LVWKGCLEHGDHAIAFVIELLEAYGARYASSDFTRAR